MQTGAIRAKVLAILEERYPCGWVPRGTTAILAAEVGVSRQRVAAIIKALGWETRSVPSKVFYRCVCGRVQESAELCDACRHVQLPCGTCGAPVRMLASVIVRRLTRRVYEGVPTYRRPVYCNRSCAAATIGRVQTAVWRETIPAVDDRLWAAADADGTLRFGTLSRVSRATGYGREAVARRATTLGLRMRHWGSARRD